MSEQMAAIENLRRKLADVETIEELMEIEGNIRQEYYKAWNVIIRDALSVSCKPLSPSTKLLSVICFRLSKEKIRRSAISGLKISDTSSAREYRLVPG